MNARAVLPLAVGGFFVAAGIAHFIWPASYARIVPEALPAHRELVVVSGVAEIAGGLALFAVPTRTAAGWGLLALLLAVYPANIAMALNAARFADLAPAWVLWARLPLQFVAGWLVVRAMRTVS